MNALCAVHMRHFVKKAIRGVFTRSVLLYYFHCNVIFAVDMYACENRDFIRKNSVLEYRRASLTGFARKITF